jgi:DNA-directed RNA polymerase subunit M/transcription elongation factor TFIIS
MKFCSICNRAIKKTIKNGSVSFVCVCGNIEKETPEDTLISSTAIGSIEIASMYESLIESAPFDNTNQLVSKDCPNCGRDYLTQIRISSAEIIIYRCKCGYTAEFN